MNSRPRALVLLIVLSALWGSLVASPFRAFAELCRFGADALGRAFGLSAPVAALVAYVFVLAVLIALLLVSRSKADHYVAPLCALAAFGYQIVSAVLGGHAFTVAITTSVSLALALAFLLPKSRRPAMWLGDAFTMGLVAMVLYDAVVVPVAKKLDLTLPVVKDWFEVPTSSLVVGMDKLWRLDFLLWGGIVAFVFLIPTVFLTVNRPKG